MDFFDVAVVGGGPAGLSAGFYLSRAGYKTVLFECGRVGGKTGRLPMIYNYPGFPAGIRGDVLARRLGRQARRFGLRPRREEIVSIKPAGKRRLLAAAGGGRWSARSVILATGTEFRRLGLERESAWRGRGMHNAVFSAAWRFAGKVVGVVGGGETAAHQALALAEHARRVHLFVRGCALKAIAPLREGIHRHPRVSVHWKAALRRLDGAGRLSAVRWGRADGRGRSRELALDALFVLIGQRPRLPDMRPPVKGKRGVFVAGDASGDRPRQAAVAAADGLAKAMACERFLNAAGVRAETKKVRGAGIYAG